MQPIFQTLQPKKSEAPATEKVKSVAEITFHQRNNRKQPISFRFSVAIYDILQPKSRFRLNILLTEKVEIGSNFGSGISLFQIEKA